MTAPDIRRLLACIATIVALALAGCGGSDAQRTPSHPSSSGPESIAASDGATAIFRADVTPILCHYARDVAKSTQLIAQASSDAGGAINASAPESAQAEYAGALQLYASLLATDYAAFASVRAPSPLNHAYQQFLESLDTISRQANQLARYAHARNFTAIANEQSFQTPTAGQEVFGQAGITTCTAPTH
jgi:hypothetical protein